MLEVIGYVSKQSGEVHVTKTDGEVLELGIFSQIHKNDQIKTLDGSELEIVFDNGNILTVDGERSLSIDETVYEKEPFDISDVSSNTLEDIVNEIDDIETEAGEEGPVGSGTDITSEISGQHIDNLGFAHAQGLDTQRNTTTTILEENTVGLREGTGDINSNPTTVTPPVTSANDAPVITIDSVTTFVEDAATNAVGSTVATYTTSDADIGDTVTVILSDTTNYALSGNTVVLTQAGLDLVNAGTDLPAFTLIPNDGTIDGNTGSVDPAVTTFNDPLVFAMNPANTFTEDGAGTVVGASVATVNTATDEDGGTITFSTADTTGYYAVNATTGEVTLTQNGVDHVNAGNDLPAINVVATSDNSTANESVDPAVTTFNDPLVFAMNPANTFTEDGAGTVVGASVATVNTATDEDGGTITFSTADTTGYYAVNATTGEVTLTQNGVDHVNAGNDLPAINVVATSDNSTANESVDPAVTTFNDPLVFAMNPANTFTEDGAGTVVGASVATVNTATDEDGGTITFSTADTTGYYAVNATTGEVTLTQNGVDHVNAGNDLPAINVVATSDNSTANESVDPAVTTFNDPLVFAMNPANTFTEDGAGTVVGASVATVNTATDEDGGTITFSTADTTGYYAVNATTGEVTLTQNGVDHVNAGNDLPAINVVATSDNSTANESVDPAVTTFNDPLVFAMNPANTFTEDGAGTVVGASVATVNTATDEDGGTITFSTADTTGYYAVNATTGEVTLTQNGVDHVNAGNDLPAINVVATSDNSTANESVDPAVTTFNDPLVFAMNPANTFTEDGAGTVVGASVATVNTATDEDGGTITFSTADTTGYYAVNATTGEVTLTQNGVDHVNAGNDLPAINVVATSDNSTANESVDPAVTTFNDPLVFAMNPANTFTEDGAGTVVGASVATVNTATDEDGGTITFSTADTTGYYAVNATTGEVTLTQNGVDHVNAGNDLPAINVVATSDNSTANESVDPAVTTFNDPLVFAMNPANTFTEDGAGTVVGASVATVNTATDEDGGTITFSTADTTGYYAVNATTGEVTLTQNGVDHVNAGNDLPAINVVATSDNSTANESVDPAVTTFNDPLVLNVVPETVLFVEDSTAAGDTVATATATDEDGGVITYSISDTINYAIDENGVVTLTADGAALVNGGGDLPDFDVTATSTNSTATVLSVNPANTDPINDAATITLTGTTASFTEDATASGAEVATFTTADEDGDAVTVTLSNTTYYAISGNTVVLTQAGADLVNSGSDLPAFTISATDNIQINHATADVTPPATTDVNDVPVFTTTTDTATLMEGALATGNENTTDTVVHTGTFGISDEDSSITVTLNAPTTTMTSNGETIIWTGNGTSTLSGSTTSGGNVITMNIDNTGSYTVTLLGPVDHTVSGVEDILSFDVGVNASDGNSTTSGTLTIDVTDDIPETNDIIQNLTLNSNEMVTTNLVLVLDTSGSMSNSVTLADGTTTTRLQLAKDALSNMIDKYDELGNVNVQLIGFASTSTESGWYEDDVAGALQYINSLTDNGGTDYQDALQTVMNGYTEPTATNTVLYFLSDGDSTEGNINNLSYTDLDANAHTGVNAWEEFIVDSIDNVFSIGLGSDVTTNNTNTGGDLEDVAYPGSAILVADETDLNRTLYETINTGASGTISVITSGVSGEGISVGADEGRIDKITLSDGTEILYDSGVTQPIIISTPLGGTLSINFVTGDYTYDVTLTDTNYGTQEIFGITVIDNDGDFGSADLTVNLDFTATIDANRDNIITNATDGNPLNVSFDALTANDSMNDLSSVTNVSGDATLNSHSITLNNVTDGDSYTYTLSDGTITDSTAADVTLANSDTLIGTDNDDIIINARSTTVAAANVVDAVVLAGNTYNQDNQIGFIYTAAASGVSISSITLDLRAGTDTNAYFDTSGSGSSAPAIGASTTGITSNDVNFNAPDGSPTMTVNFANGSFTDGDAFWFGVDTDNLGNNTGSSFGNSGVEVTITYSDGSSVSGTYITNADGSSSIQVIDGSYMDGGAGDDVLIGNASDELLIGNTGDDYLDGGAGADMLQAGEGNDTLVFDSADLLIDGGAGFDTLVFTTDTVLDFSNIDSLTNPVTNIEQIDLSSADVTLDKLTVEDVLDMTGNGTELTILGGSNDTVNLQDSLTNWSATGQVSENGRTFDIYTNDTITVKIEQDINDNIVT